MCIRDRGVIASSPTNIQPVLDALTERAARLCDADDAQLFLTSGDVLQRVAGYGSIPFVTTIPAISRKTPGGRAVIDRATVHVCLLYTSDAADERSSVDLG